MDWIGIGLVGLGVAWESLLAPSVVGWGFVLVGFLLMLLPERRWPCRTPLDWPLVTLGAMGGVSLLVTPLPEVTKTHVMRLWAGLVGFYGLVNWARGHHSRLPLIASGLVTGGVALALIAPVSVDWNVTKAVFIPAFVYKPFPLLLPDAVHPNVMAALLVILLPLALAWLISSGGLGSRWLFLKRLALGGAVLLMGVILLLTKSRAGYIAGALGALVVTWLLERKRLALALAVGVVGMGTWLLIATGGQAPDLVEGATDPSTWAFRQRVWRAALWMLSDFAFTGAGMGAFNDVASVLYAYHETQNPGAHNLYLQTGVDLGFPGLIALLAAMMLVIWASVVAIRTFEREGEETLHALAVGTLGGMGAMMTFGLFDITAWGTRAAFIPWLAMGLAVALYLEAKRMPSDE